MPCSQSAVVNDRPGEAPPAYSPQPRPAARPRRARVSRPVRTTQQVAAADPGAVCPGRRWWLSRCSAVMAKPSGSSPSVPISAPSARPTSSSTPRPAMQSATVSMPVTRSPSLVTTSPARRPFQAWPWSKMWPRPSHCVLACSGMKMTSSAPPIPCGKPWVPRSASCPVSSIVCTGLVRRRHPVCGPSVSNGCAREKLAPRRTSAAPSRRLASSRKFSVPSTSSAPQRPRLEQRLAAAAIAPSGSRGSTWARHGRRPPRNGWAWERARHPPGWDVAHRASCV